MNQCCEFGSGSGRIRNFFRIRNNLFRIRLEWKRRKILNLIPKILFLLILGCGFWTVVLKCEIENFSNWCNTNRNILFSHTLLRLASFCFLLAGELAACSWLTSFSVLWHGDLSNVIPSAEADADCRRLLLLLPLPPAKQYHSLVT